MMYCPYAVNRHLVQQTTQEYDESGNQTLQQVIRSEERRVGKECW